MYRALIKIFVALALATGLTYATAGTSTAAPAQRVAQRAADCSSQQAAADSADATYRTDARKAAKAKKAVQKAKQAAKKAKSRSAKKKANQKLKKARSAYKRAVARRDASANAASARRSELASCQSNSGGSTGGTGGTGTNPTPQNGATASQIQVLCTNGLPQSVCDQLGGLIPGGSATSSFATLCNQVPDAAPLCTLLSSGPALSGASLVTVIDQVLSTLGLDSLLGQVGGLLGVGQVYSPAQLSTLISSGFGLVPLP